MSAWYSSLVEAWQSLLVMLHGHGRGEKGNGEVHESNCGRVARDGGQGEDGTGGT